MYGGTIDKRVVFSSHPVIVVDCAAVVGSFQTTLEAENFVRGAARFEALIFRHSGQEWVRFPFREPSLLLGPSNADSPLFG